jgi:riboflavin kinase / FMN adenylyltransferase
MRIYHSPDDFTKLSNAIVTSGTFDGVHLGHQKIISRLKEVAEKSHGETVVITFWPHPRLILKPEDTTLRLLNTFEEKADLLKKQGVQHLLRIAFTKEFSNITSQEFITSILVNTIGTKKLVIGYDHRFGNNREGSFDQLKINGPTYGFDVEEIERQDIDHVTISSSEIRKSLEEGDLETATHLLGRAYSISGQVVSGDKLGRVLGYPTANIDPDSRLKLIPSDGIYAVTILYEQTQLKGMLYIGNRPTISGAKRVIEVNIFDFNKEIYGETLTVYFHQLIRGDSKFHDLEELRTQLHQDKIDTLQILKDK